MRLSILFLLLSFTGFSQNWDLNRCIDTGLINNHLLQSSAISSSMLNESLKESRAQYLPSINGGLTHGYNWGQTLDPFTNEFASNRVQYNNFYLRSSVVLFSGMRNFYNIKQRENDIRLQGVNQRLQERDLKIEIATAYLQILLNKEILQISLEHLEMSKEQKKRMELIVQEGNETQYKVHEINAQVERDKFTAFSAQNDLNFALLSLQQLINIPYDSAFNILNTDHSLNGIELANNEVPMDQFSEVEIAELDAKRLQLDDKFIRSSLYPSLTINSVFGTGYSSNNTYQLNGGDVVKPVNDQLSENFYQSAFASLQVPIFNRRLVKTQLKINELERRQNELDQKLAIQVVEKRYEELQMMTTNSAQEVKMAQSVQDLVQLNFSQSEIQYQNGKISFNDLQEVRNQLFVAQSQLIQSKYSSKINRLVLAFYQEQR